MEGSIAGPTAGPGRCSGAAASSPAVQRSSCSCCRSQLSPRNGCQSGEISPAGPFWTPPFCRKNSRLFLRYSPFVDLKILFCKLIYFIKKKTSDVETVWERSVGLHRENLSGSVDTAPVRKTICNGLMSFKLCYWSGSDLEVRIRILYKKWLILISKIFFFLNFLFRISFVKIPIVLFYSQFLFIIQNLLVIIQF